MSDQGNPSATPTTPTPAPTPDPAALPAAEPAAAAPPAPEPSAESESLLGKEPEAAPEPFDPEKITFPEGFEKDEALFGDFTNVAKEAGLSGPAAQKLIDLAAKQVAQANERLMAGWNKQQEDWLAEIKADKDIGGDKLDGTLQTFAKVANDHALSDPKFREALAFTGAGNHPAIVRTLAKWASALSEGGPVRGSPAGERRTPSTLGEAFYPEGPHQGGPKLT